MALATPMATVTFSAKDLDDLFTDAAFWAALRAKIEPRIRDLFTELFLAGATLGRSVTPVENKDLLPLSPFEINNAAQRVIDTHMDEWWSQFTTTTQHQMRGVFSMARVRGASLEDIIDDLAPLFGTERAMRIAATETTRLFGAGAQATYAAAGIDQWSWQTVSDPAVDPICRDLQGKRFPISLPFSPAHVNCRCFPRPVTDIPTGRAPRKPRTPRAPAPEGAPAPVTPPKAPEIGKADTYPREDFAKVPAIESFMKTNFPETHWSFTELEPKVANVLARRLFELSKEWPGGQQRLAYVGTNRMVPPELKRFVARFGGNTYAHVAYQGKSISFNPRYFGKEATAKLSIDSDVKTNWHPGMATAGDYASVVTHEWGHVVDYWLRSATNRQLTTAIHMSGFGDVASTFQSWKEALFREARNAPNAIAMGRTGRGVILPSRYAWKNDMEAFAELFSASVHGSPEVLAQPLVRFTKALVEKLRLPSHQPRVGEVRFTSDLPRESELRDQVLLELADLAEEIGLAEFAHRVLGLPSRQGRLFE